MQTTTQAKPKLDTFTLAYLECALWSSTGENGLPLDRDYGIHDVSAEAIARAMADCAKFQGENASEIAGGDTDRAGHDFWLTRNGHGAGFWDGDWEDADGKKLTDASHAFGEVDLYAGDDGELYFS